MRATDLLVLLLGSVVISGVLGNPVKPPNTIVVVAVREECFTFVDLLRKFDLQPTLEFKGPFTVFIPNDNAFSTFESSEGSISTADPERMRNILLAHITEGVTPLSSIEDGHRITPLLGCHPLEFSSDEGVRRVNGSTIISSDIEADNGLVNIIDKVIVPVSELSCLLDPVDPPQEAAAPDEGNIIEVFEREGFNTFLDLIQELGIDLIAKERGHFTVFAPTNEAFNAIDPTRLGDLRADPETFTGILLSHIVEEDLPSGRPKHGSMLTPLKEGQQLTIADDENGAFVNGATFGDGIKATNGLIYPLNQVLFLPEEGIVPEVISLSPDKPVEEAHENVYERIIENGCLTFAHLMADSNITSILEQQGPYTVFAPTDEAFQLVGAGALDDIKSNPVLLENLLRAHIADGIITSAEFKDGLQVKPLLETYSLDFASNELGDAWTVNGAQVVSRDVRASNGVVHIVDKVFASPYQDETSSSPLESESPLEDNTQPRDSENPEVEVQSSVFNPDALDQFQRDFGQISQLVYVTDPKIEEIIDGKIDIIPENQDPTSDQTSPEQHKKEVETQAKEKIDDTEKPIPVPSPNEDHIAGNEEHATVEEVQLTQENENRESRKQDEASIPNLVPEEKDIENLGVIELQQDHHDEINIDQTEALNESRVEASEDTLVEEIKPEEITEEKELTVQTSYSEADEENPERDLQHQT